MNHQERQEFHPDFEQAFAFAARLHAGQTRKETDIRYISHPIAVAGLVLEHGGNRDEAIGALLHDAIEDCGWNYPGGVTALRTEIRERFGPEVLDIVEGCTDADTEPKPPWAERKARYIAHLGAASDSVRLVSCADKVHNARAILADMRVLDDVLFDRFHGGKAGTLWYYRKLAEAFLNLGPSALAQELDRTVREIEQLAWQADGDVIR
jgi:GTP pyrophosphokinase